MWRKQQVVAARGRLYGEKSGSVGVVQGVDARAVFGRAPTLRWPEFDPGLVQHGAFHGRVAGAEKAAVDPVFDSRLAVTTSDKIYYVKSPGEGRRLAALIPWNRFSLAWAAVLLATLHKIAPLL